MRLGGRQTRATQRGGTRMDSLAPSSKHAEASLLSADEPFAWLTDKYLNVLSRFSADRSCR